MQFHRQLRVWCRCVILLAPTLLRLVVIFERSFYKRVSHLAEVLDWCSPSHVYLPTEGKQRVQTSTNDVPFADVIPNLCSQETPVFDLNCLLNSLIAIAEGHGPYALLKLDRTSHERFIPSVDFARFLQRVPNGCTMCTKSHYR